MAEELDPNAGDTITPADDESPPAEPLTIEGLAAEKGWVPQDQFRGEPEKWRPADEWIRTGLDSSRSMSKELRSVRDEVSRISRTSAQILEDQVTAARAERDAHWRGVHAKAVEEGDTNAANQAVGEIVKLQAATPAPAAPNGEPPETVEFRERNKSWFEKDPLATSRAKAAAEEARAAGYDIPTQLQAAERAAKRDFPELFPAPGKGPAAVQTGQSRNANNSSRKKGFADMPVESQNMAKDYLARHGIPLEKTAESYWADPRNHERKVG